MANFRYINTEFWEDDYIGNLPKDHRYLWLYLLTNPCTNIAGAYQIKLKRIALDTDLDMDTIKAGLKQFEKDEKVFYKDGWVLIKNFIKHQSSSTKVLKGMVSILYNSPQWIQDRVSIWYPYLTDTLSIPLHIRNRIEKNRIEKNGNGISADSVPAAVSVFREFFPKYKISPFQEDLLSTAEIVETEFRECMKFWASRGYSEKNIGGILDCYVNQGYKPKDKQGNAEKPFVVDMLPPAPTYEERVALLVAKGLPAKMGGGGQDA